VKDSFGCLDLEPFCFRPLFDAEWLVASELKISCPDDAGKVRWVLINDDVELVRWEQAWRQGSDKNDIPIFRPELLVKPNVRFVYGFCRRRACGWWHPKRNEGCHGVIKCVRVRDYDRSRNARPCDDSSGMASRTFTRHL